MKIPGYTILRSIGEGGMATAYLALQQSLQRQVVLKVLHSADRNRREDSERFLREGRIVASLNHANVINIYDIGVTESLLYMCMEYVDGGDLRNRLQSPLPATEALRILSAIGSGLGAAHKKGIIHRDVKPGNILFRRDGTPLLTDFGIAKEISLDHDLTHTGVFVGSPNYMAPEQAATGPIDGRADIYSLGIILYEMLTGDKPYQGDSVVDIIVKHKHAPLPGLPAELALYQPLLGLMLAKDRKDRFRDADSMLHYLRQFSRPAPEATATLADSQAAQPEPEPAFGHAGDKTQRFRLPEGVSRWRYPLLLSLLITAGLGALLLAKIEANPALGKSGTNTIPEPAAVDLASAQQPPLPVAAPIPVEVRTHPERGTRDVVTALIWLGQHSLDQYRLTSPPKDNAYYYYSRLRELEPNSPEAMRGFLKIAEGFARLAEQELAADRYEHARRYAELGSRFDPQNRALHSLLRLTAQPPKGWMQRLLDLFGTG